MRYVGPLTDFGLKKIFTELLGQPISLLNDALALKNEGLSSDRVG
ncbi:MAG: hypothetical protein WAW42_09085 [Candidatus Competibacteraceae bacterium]|jgi:hypothetical protein